jgi:hypothetical protein
MSPKGNDARVEQRGIVSHWLMVPKTFPPFKSELIEEAAPSRSKRRQKQRFNCVRLMVEGQLGYANSHCLPVAHMCESCVLEAGEGI